MHQGGRQDDQSDGATLLSRLHVGRSPPRPAEGRRLTGAPVRRSSAAQEVSELTSTVRSATKKRRGAAVGKIDYHKKCRLSITFTDELILIQSHSDIL